MSLPTCREIVAQLPHLPHTERIRLVVRAARKHAADAALPSLLDELAALSAYHAGLVVETARAVGDHGRLAVLARHPSAGVRIRARAALPLQTRSRERLSAAYLAMPLDERRAFETRLHRERRTDLVGILLGLPLADRDRARLLKSADEAKAAELVADLGDLVPSVAGLARRHPDVVVAELGRRLTGAAPAVRDEAWAWAAPALSALAVSRPGELVGLLRTAGPTNVIPRAVESRLGLLLRHDPQAVTDLLAGCPWRAGMRRGRTGLLGGLRDRVPLLTARQRAALARAWRDDDARLAALLTALPPGERAEVFTAAFEGARTDTRVWSAELLDALPTALRQAEAVRIAALPVSAEPLRRLELAAFMDPARAREAAAAHLHAREPVERGAAWTALIGSAARTRRPDRVAAVLEELPRAANEQDPVRAVIAEAIEAVPTVILSAAGARSLARFARTALQARDTSSRTLGALQRTAWRLIVHEAGAGADGDAAELLAALTEDGRISGIPARLPLDDEGAALLIGALAPALRRAAERHSFDMLWRLWAALGRRAWSSGTLVGLARRALDGPQNHMRIRAASALLADPATRAERVDEILACDETFATQETVQRAVCRGREDLVGVFFRRRALKGRFWHGPGAYVPIWLPGPFSRWLPEHLRAYAGALHRLRRQASTTDPDRCRIAALVVSLPTARPKDLSALLGSRSVPVRESALAALSASHDPESSLGLLLEHAATDRARVAMAAAARCARRISPDRAARAFCDLLGAPARVIARKEAARVLGRLRVTAGLPALTRVGLDSATHADVRAAVGRALLDYLDDPRAWEVLASIARDGGRDAALSLAATVPRQVAARHRRAYAELLLTASDEPELVRALAAWRLQLPGLPDRLAGTVMEGTPPAARAAIEAVAAHGAVVTDWGPHLRLVRRLADAAASPAEPDAAETADLPHLRRLERLVDLLISLDGPQLDWHRAHLVALGETLEGSPLTARASWRAHLAALDWEDPAADLLRLADQVVDPSLAAGLLIDAQAAITAAEAARLLPAGGLGAETADSLLEREDAAAGALALAVVGHQGAAGGWTEPWRERLRALRRHRAGLVAAGARGIVTAAEQHEPV